VDADHVDVELRGELIGSEGFREAHEHLTGVVDDDVRRARLRQHSGSRRVH
jgi:hypothetical protein